MHPVLDSLTNTEHDWLRTLLFTFNNGDIGKFEALGPHLSKQVKKKGLFPWGMETDCFLYSLFYSKMPLR
jgi:hypothetical protein